MRKILYWRYSLIIYFILIAGFNYVLLQFPLTKVFGYEFSAFNSILLSLLSGIHTLSVLNNINKENKSESFLTLRINLLIFLSVPFLISVINSYLTGFCSFIDGLLFYFVLTLPSVVIGSGLAFITFRLISRFRLTVYIVIYILLVLLAFAEIYFNHQVYLYNPIFGYFPGTIFDEGLSVDLKLTVYRLLNLIFFAWISVVIANNMLDTSIRRKLFLVYVLFLSGIFYFFSSYFGFTTTDSTIKHKLPNRVQSPNFIIHSSGKISKKTLQYIALNCENSYSDLGKYFNERLSEPITVFLFDSPQQQKEIFGSENADVAKPWLKTIYTSVNNWEFTLRHEIVHCLSAQFGTGIFRLAAGYNPALIEGVAEAGDAFYDEYFIHNLAATAYNNGYKVDINELFTGLGFFSRTSTLSYVYAGSFCKYLIDKFGAIKFKQFYASGDFKDVYNVPINQIIPQYNDFLKSSVRDKHTARADYYFGKQSLFEKICPRFISKELQSGWKYLGRGDVKKAAEIFNGIIELNKDFNALVGLAECYDKMGQIKNSISILEKNKNEFNGTNYYYNLSFILANYYAKVGKLSSADSLYSFLESENPNKRLQILSALRSELIKDNTIDTYIKGSDFDKYHILRRLNSSRNLNSAIPSLIELSERLDENYSFFISQFDVSFMNDGKYSSYALLMLSRFMMKNLDFERARRVALLAVRYRKETDLYSLLEANLKKATWFHAKGNQIIPKLIFSREK